VEVRDESGLPGSRGSHVITLLGPYHRRSYMARTRLMRRGVFQLGPTSLMAGDPFGLFPARKETPHAASLLVYPMMVELPSFPNPPGLLAGGEALRRRTHYITPNAAGIREYMPGDSLNRIHWPTTARRNKLMVKEFELDPLADIWLFVDGEAAVHFALPDPVVDAPSRLFYLERSPQFALPPATEEYAATIAASLARYYLRHRRAVGLTVRGATSAVIPPDRGGRQLGKILEALAIFRGTGNLPLTGLIEAQALHIARGSTIVLITPTVRQQLLGDVDYLVRKGLRPVVVLIDPKSFGGPAGTEGLAVHFHAMNIPVRRVQEGVPLEEALAAYPQ